MNKEGIAVTHPSFLTAWFFW